MNFKRYHISTNLLDFDALENAPSGIIGTTTITHLLILTLKPNTVYTVISNGQGGTGGSAGDNRCIYVNGTNIDNVAFAEHPVTGTTTVSGEMKIGFFSERSNAQQYINGDAQVWLVEGSDATVPYEPYGDTWHNIPHYIHNTSTDTLTTLPVDINANDTTATVGLKGQMEQSSQPSPTTPIQPSECGKRTNNLIDVEPFTVEANDGSQNLLLWSGTLPVGNYTMSVNQDDTLTSSTRNCIRINIGGTTYYENSGENYHNNSGIHTMPIPISGSAQTVEIRYWAHSLSNRCTYSNIMLNTGSTALPYEPYGIKIPILSGGVTTPVYLGEVQTTRKIKKLVLTGGDDENWSEIALGTNDYIYRIGLSDLPKSGFAPICTHYTGSTATRWADVANYEITTSISNSVAIRHSGLTGVSDWKTFLQQQYANGTPVTVWYVLAEPTTGIVNEPLRKIGDYADEVSGITIPTTAGANTLSIDTTLQPSEVSVTYHGWHPVQSVHERESGQWD